MKTISTLEPPAYRGGIGTPVSARRGMVALSLPVGDAECARLVEAVGEFVQARGPLLP